MADDGGDAAAARQQPASTSGGGDPAAHNGSKKRQATASCDGQLASRQAQRCTQLAAPAAGVPASYPPAAHREHPHPYPRRRAAGAPKTGAAKYSRGESVNTRRITDVKLKAKVKYSERCVRLRASALCTFPLRGATGTSAEGRGSLARWPRASSTAGAARSVGVVEVARGGCLSALLLEATLTPCAAPSSPPAGCSTKPLPARLRPWSGCCRRRRASWRRTA